MKLTDLNPRWVFSGGEGVRNADGSPAPRREGVGVTFNCPLAQGCRHYAPFENPLDGGPPLEPGKGWQRTGDTFETLTPSYQVVGGCGWHGYITNGEVLTC
jgi:hypothetical protein